MTTKEVELAEENRLLREEIARLKLLLGQRVDSGELYKCAADGESPSQPSHSAAKTHNYNIQCFHSESRPETSNSLMATTYPDSEFRESEGSADRHKEEFRYLQDANAALFKKLIPTERFEELTKEEPGLAFDPTSIVLPRSNTSFSYERNLRTGDSTTELRRQKEELLPSKLLLQPQAQPSRQYATVGSASKHLSCNKSAIIGTGGGSRKAAVPSRREERKGVSQSKMLSPKASRTRRTEAAKSEVKAGREVKKPAFVPPRPAFARRITVPDKVLMAAQKPGIESIKQRVESLYNTKPGHMQSKPIRRRCPQCIKLLSRGIPTTYCPCNKRY